MLRARCQVSSSITTAGGSSIASNASAVWVSGSTAARTKCGEYWAAWAWRWFPRRRASCRTSRRARPVPAAKCSSSFNSFKARRFQAGFTMSRVAKKPVDLPQGVTVTIGGESVTVKGTKGSLTLALKTGIKVVQQDKHLAVEASGDRERLNALTGATRAHLANMVPGVA